MAKLLWTYRIGMPVGALIAIVVPTHSHLLIFSWSHMILLAVLGSPVPKPYHLAAGKKIEIAGYLYTLIGVAAALFAATDSSFASRTLLFPMGAALGTSIFGYFMGGEIAGKSAVTPEKSIRFEGEKVAAELEGFAAALRLVHEQYVKTMSDAKEEFEELHITQAELAKSATKMIGDLNNTMARMLAAVSGSAESVERAGRGIEDHLGEAFIRILSRIRTQAESAADEFGGTANAARDVTKYLSETRILIEELEKILESMTSERWSS
jgi:hypothetical protein